MVFGSVQTLSSLGEGTRPSVFASPSEGERGYGLVKEKEMNEVSAFAS